jgi:Myosin N-terminal SH3-like domain
MQIFDVTKIYKILDPSPWLIVSPELKEKLKSKPYDPKKSCWVPNKATHGYDEGLIEATEGDKVTVRNIQTKEVGSFCFKNPTNDLKLLI